jgi:anaerobic C4-dicarboxylate transporter
MFACQAWQWLTAVALSVASYWMTADRLRTAALVPLYTFLAVPPLALMAVVVGTLSAETLLNRQIRVGE